MHDGRAARCIWLTGLSGAGKTTLAGLLEQALHERGERVCVLDGDQLRLGLCRDLGYSSADRAENVRRAAEVARLMVDAGLTVIVSLISPFRAGRQQARERFAAGAFLEVFVDTPFAECVRRDVKGLYARALKGDVQQFTAIDSPYEPPEHPEVHLHAGADSPGYCLQQILDALAGETAQPV